MTQNHRHEMSRPTNKPIDRKWSWLRGVVDTSSEHLLLTNGKNDAEPECSQEIARISRPNKRTFTVEFLIDENDPAYEGARGEIDFILIEKQESDAWLYACHHCTTAANIYGEIHWSLVKANAKDRIQATKKSRPHKRST